MKTILLFWFLSASLIFSQSLNFIIEFGNFNSASSFDVDLNSNFYVADQLNNTIHKFDSLGNEIINIGGYGWEESTFDSPVNVYTNTLSVYIADKNNNRVQRLDKDLNFLSEYTGSDGTSDIEFGYPTFVAISNIGDLFILDSDNNRILKYNLTGEFLYEIGGNDAGSLAIDNPKNFTIDMNGNLFVLDDNKIKVFDQYGNGQFEFQPTIESHRIKFTGNNLWFIDQSKLTEFSLIERKVLSEYTVLQNLNNEDIVDVEFSYPYLFVLTPKRIIKYKILP